MSLPKMSIEETKDKSEKVGKQAQTIWGEPAFVELRSERQIKDEDLPILEELARLPKSIALDHHNYFSLNRDNTPESLTRDIKEISQKLEKADKSEFQRLTYRLVYLQMQKQIVEKYNWQTAWNINTILEGRKKPLQANVETPIEIETRGDNLTEAQQLVCLQLISLVEKLGLKIVAKGIGTSLVTTGKVAPRIWFTGIESSREYEMTAEINVFAKLEKGVGAVVTSYSFRPYRDKLNAVPFGAVLDRYVLPDERIVLTQETKLINSQDK